jgi:hypothetical protein
LKFKFIFCHKMLILLENFRFLLENGNWKQKIEWHLRFWPNYWKMKVCYEVYSFELNLLIIHLRNYQNLFCFMLIFTKEYWNLVSCFTFKNRKYRTRTIETGRWRNIDRENRYCNLCNCQKLGDEYHYVLECSSLNDKCKQLLPKYFMKRHNVVKFFELLSTKKQSLLRKLCIFIKHINKIFCTPGLPTVVP